MEASLSPFHLHVALFDVLNSLIDIVRELLPHCNAQLALQIGCVARLGGQHRAQRIDLLLNTCQFLK